MLSILSNKQKMETFLRTHKLSKIFRTYDIETIALKNISIDIQKSEFVAVMGPSGCGKTTLLNILGMLDNPSSGSYFFNNEEVSGYPERKRVQLRKTNVGFVFQNFNLIDELNVYENVELPLIYLGYNTADRRKKVEEALDKMKMIHRQKYFPMQLSGGQQQRVAIARAVVANPALILADEPTGNLDSANGEEVMGILETLNRNGTTIVIVTHSERDADYSQRIIRLFDGKIIHENYFKHQKA